MLMMLLLSTCRHRCATLRAVPFERIHSERIVIRCSARLLLGVLLLHLYVYRCTYRIYIIRIKKKISDSNESQLLLLLLDERQRHSMKLH